MVDKNKPLGKIEKVFAFLFIASIALIPIGIIVLVAGPAKTVKTYSLADSNAYLAEPLVLAGVDQIHCELSPTAGDAEVDLFEADQYNN